MAYGIVKQSGGYIWVFSELGKGASFKILLPAVADALSAPSHNPQPPKSTTKACTILVVEDEASLRELILESLTRNGYRVLAASTGAEALEIERSLNGPIHLLLTDVVLPGMNGPSLAKRLTAIRPEMRVLLMSGYVEFESNGRGSVSLEAPLLQKPFTSDGLLSHVAEALSPSQAEILA